MKNRLTFLAFLAVLVSMSGLCYADLTTGLVAYYLFNDDYEDGSPNNYNAENVDTVFTTDRFETANSAVLFDDYLERIKLPHQVLDGRNDFTVFARIKWFLSGDPVHTIVSGANSTYDNEALLVYREDLTDFTTSVHNSVGWANVSVSADQWYSVAWLRDGDTGTSEIYINGDDGPYVSSDSSGPVSISEDGLWLGLDQDSVGGGWESVDQFYGIMDDVYFYNRVLSADDVKELHDLPEPATLALLLIGGLALLRRRFVRR